LARAAFDTTFNLPISSYSSASCVRGPPPTEYGRRFVAPD
jgi:hypothetical protein